MFHYTPKDIERFWSKVNKNGSIPEHMPHLGECWEWNLSCYKNRGYFTCQHKYKFLSSRVSWEITNGEIPNNLFVLHKCDNSRCVRPDHLFLGTQKDNVDDMYAKGREGNHKGDNNGMHKLSINEIIEIRNLYIKGGFSQSELGIKYGVKQPSISRIVNRKRWD